MTDIGIGLICNNNCIMCTTLMPQKDNSWPPLNQVLTQIDKLKESDSFTITGGEPTLREDLFDILKYINTSCPNAKINLITNGRMLCYPGYTNKFRSIKKLEIVTELHADNAELHDFITHTPGSFEQAYRGIKNTHAMGIKVEFRIVISKLNYTNIAAIACLVNKEFSEVNRVVIFPIDLIGNAYKNKNKVAVKYSDIVPYVEKAIDILKPKTELYHFPYCIIKQKYHKHIKKGITVLERRVAFLSVCEVCKFDKDCSRLWKTYLKEFGSKEFERK